jgi:hypothetical protein
MQADEACKKAEELQQPTLQVGWEYQNGFDEWIEIESNTNHPLFPYKSMQGLVYTREGRNNAFNPDDCVNLILSTGRPVKKVQIDDEVEALAREIYVHNITLIESENTFAYAEKFINHRNERRGKNGK